MCSISLEMRERNNTEVHIFNRKFDTFRYGMLQNAKFCVRNLQNLRLSMKLVFRKSSRLKMRLLIWVCNIWNRPTIYILKSKIPKWHLLHFEFLSKLVK